MRMSKHVLCRGSTVSICLLIVLKLQNIAFLSIVFEGVFLDGKYYSLPGYDFMNEKQLFLQNFIN